MPRVDSLTLSNIHSPTPRPAMGFENAMAASRSEFPTSDLIRTATSSIKKYR
jgi:hypothetical protein